MPICKKIPLFFNNAIRRVQVFPGLIMHCVRARPAESRRQSKILIRRNNVGFPFRMRRRSKQSVALFYCRRRGENPFFSAGLRRGIKFMLSPPRNQSSLGRSPRYMYSTGARVKSYFISPERLQPLHPANRCEEPFVSLR